MELVALKDFIITQHVRVKYILSTTTEIYVPIYKYNETYYSCVV